MRVRLYMVVTAGLLLSGCASTTPSSSAPTFTAIESPSPVASLEPSPTVAPPEKAVVTTEGYGAIAIGQPVSSHGEAEQLITWREDACSDGYGAWVEAGLDPMVDATYAQDGVHFVVDSTGSRTDPIASIVFFNEGAPATDRGITVGSPEAELRAAYPQPDLEVDFGGNGALYVVNGVAGRLQFVIYEAKVSSFGVTAGAADDGSNRLGPSDWYFPCS